MEKFQSVPRVVVAKQWFPGVDHPGIVSKQPAIKNIGQGIDEPECVFVRTAHGDLAIVREGDWIITEPNGFNNYPCKPEIFERNYKPAPATSVTIEHIEGLIQSESFSNTGKTTVCILKLKNGFEVVGTSGIVDPSKFDEVLGNRYAREEAVNKIWMLEGYRLQWSLYEVAN